jgi:hypothetical protein
MKAVLNSGKHATGVFPIGFLFACLLFWWLPSLLFRLTGAVDPVEDGTLQISFLGLASFVLGYFLPPIRLRSAVPMRLVDICEALAYKGTLCLGFPALALAIQFFLSRSGVQYGEGEGISLLHQAVFYSHMFVAFLFLGAARILPENRRKTVIASILVIAPRLIVSLCWGRFFLLQAVIPIFLILLARGWFELTAKRLSQLVVAALFVLFGPALTRGDDLLGGQELLTFFQAGSSLLRFQDNRDLDLTGRCPTLLVSMTAKLIPYGLLDVCTMEIYGSKSMPATLDRILTKNDPANEGSLRGTGSNYLLELYLTGGWTALSFGSVLFGFTSRCFVCAIGKRSLFAGVWAECLSRALFAPRSTLGYVYERIPTLVSATLLMIALAWVLYSLAGTWKNHKAGQSTRLPIR